MSRHTRSDLLRDRLAVMLSSRRSWATGWFGRMSSTGQSSTRRSGATVGLGRGPLHLSVRMPLKSRMATSISGRNGMLQAGCSAAQSELSRHLCHAMVTTNAGHKSKSHGDNGEHSGCSPTRFRRARTRLSTVRKSMSWSASVSSDPTLSRTMCTGRMDQIRRAPAGCNQRLRDLEPDFTHMALSGHLRSTHFTWMG